MKTAKIILLTGLLVGTLDGIAAIVTFLLNGGDNPLLITKHIASGVFGSSAFKGGIGMALSGILFHYIIALLWTAFFFMIYPWIRTIRFSWYVLGILYGVLVWIVMNLMVVPLSNVPSTSRNLTGDLVGIVILIVTVGLPIAWIQSRAAFKKGLSKKQF